MGRYDDDDYEVDSTDTEVEEDSDTGGDAADDFDERNARRSIEKGWGKAEQVKSASSAFAERFNPDASVNLVKFLDDEPYTSFRYHWIEGREGQKSFTCIDDMHPQGCPLCSAGLKASSRFAFNIALWVDGDWVNKSYEGGSRLLDQLRSFHQEKNTGPLSRNYWAVNKSGKKGGTSTTNHNMVKERDLAEDWDAEAISEKAMATLVKGKYDASIVYIPPRKKLVEIAAEELGDD